MATRMSPSGLAVLYAKEILTKHANVQPGEEVMIMTDTESDADMIHGFMAAGNALGAQTTIVMIPPSFDVDERYPTEVAYKAIEAADVYIPMTETTGHSVHLRQDVLDYLVNKEGKKTRLLVVGGWHGGGLEAATKILRNHDYEVVNAMTVKLAEAINGGKNVHLTTKKGTDIKFSIEDIAFRVGGGYAREPGTFCAIPDGEAFGGPKEGTAEGVVVCDGAISLVCDKPHPSEPVVMTVEKGRVVKVEGGVEAEKVRQLIAKYKNADNLAEFAMGSNEFIIPNGNVNQNDKKKLGTIHIAIGDNVMQIYPHGTNACDIHVDFVMYEPTVAVDGRTIMKDGEVVI